MIDALTSVTEPARVKRPRASKDVWAALERDYRKGVLTLRELKLAHGPSPQSIIRRAARFGWTREREPIADAGRLCPVTRLAKPQASNEAGRSSDIAAEVNEPSCKHKVPVRRSRKPAATFTRDSGLDGLLLAAAEAEAVAFIESNGPALWPRELVGKLIESGGERVHSAYIADLREGVEILRRLTDNWAAQEA